MKDQNNTEAELLENTNGPIKRIVFGVVVFFVLVVGFAFFDKPEYVGDVSGTIVTLTFTDKKAKSPQYMTLVNVQLEDGKVIQTERPKAKVGDVLHLREYRRKYTGLVSYE